MCSILWREFGLTGDWRSHVSQVPLLPSPCAGAARPGWRWTDDSGIRPRRVNALIRAGDCFCAGAPDGVYDRHDDALSPEIFDQFGL
jgi:hypothetical protein